MFTVQRKTGLRVVERGRLLPSLRRVAELTPHARARMVLRGRLVAGFAQRGRDLRKWLAVTPFAGRLLMHADEWKSRLAVIYRDRVPPLRRMTHLTIRALARMIHNGGLVARFALGLSALILAVRMTLHTVGGGVVADKQRKIVMCLVALFAFRGRHDLGLVARRVGVGDTTVAIRAQNIVLYMDGVVHRTLPILNPLGVRVAGKALVILDAHENANREGIVAAKMRDDLFRAARFFFYKARDARLGMTFETFRIVAVCRALPRLVIEIHLVA